ncbi:PQQ-binding-like beta-propeller repeat protein [Nocardioides sp.]|uniref:outer membrane protein assembly factor BamB family protein n=1 Tax=Nocardioides sp. TaxID=35761 RepID=UPI002721BBDA|nr:PQQ-binding-like beta-propeller repeat protein [Nocardioides sp.]MDO9457205.1 PQQ-binding-like beta-propeller repeat protein [Nocardioides sp.]
MPTPRPRVLATGLLLALTTTYALSGCSADSEATGGSGTPSPSATSPTTTVTPAPEPTPTPEPPTPLDDLDWRSSERLGQPYEIRRYGRGYLGLETRGAARLTARGKDVWRWTPPRKKDVYGFFVGDVPVVEPTVRGGIHAVIALDPQTGEELWSTPSNGYSADDDRRVFVTSCTGERTDDSDGVCTMTARDPRSGAVLWTSYLGTYTENTSVVGGRLLVQAFRDGHRSSFLTLDPASGAVLDDDVDDEDPDYYADAIDERRLAKVDKDPRAKDGCRSTVTVYDLDGTRLWSTTLRTRPLKYTPKRCDDPFVYAAGRDVAVSGLFYPLRILDGRTGKVRWTARTAGHLEAVAAGTVVVQETDSNDTVAYDLRTGADRWRLPLITGGWTSYGGYLYTNTQCPQVESCTVVLDARTGTEVLRVEGIPQNVVASRRPGGRPALMTRVERPTFYHTQYGFVTLPPLP